MPTVLVVGGTGNVGRHVLKELLKRNVDVRAIVRSTVALSQDVIRHPKMTIIEKDLLSMKPEDLVRYVQGCDAIIMTLGHRVPWGIFAPPFYLVHNATKKLCTAIETIEPETPIKFIQLQTVGIDHPGGQDPYRDFGEKVLHRVLCLLLPPLWDDIAAADHLYKTVGKSNKYIEWCAVRPDSLVDSEKVSDYQVSPILVSSLLSPNETSKTNLAYFKAELALNTELWNKWKFEMPVIINRRDEIKHARDNMSISRRS
mmetsp:Transcript_31263/g.43326  ORF Transcript_31263/g.43326 Transcript_31263/m.43326 type:complete len:257 (-) Transcript_31263:132-902(-)|eukprot:CAMPEP_0196593778 /NCGR_PEP_ID=MMETSP1081-20130531/76547_1 /TAXON_ID=36882 /ORGANISM="Pyramimonas amylifera, Strain CCMP720" /LENGTH=256 /DNA_ID=CAMNT_0041917857 /DNA_START=127 /DNA_END=897 /DNA_ORIENTATION=-